MLVLYHYPYAICLRPDVSQYLSLNKIKYTLKVNINNASTKDIEASNIRAKMKDIYIVIQRSNCLV